VPTATGLLIGATNVVTTATMVATIGFALYFYLTLRGLQGRSPLRSGKRIQE
jgi:hypothetical protein